MRRERVNKIYWGEKQELEAKEFAITDDPIRQAILYRSLYPKLYRAAEATLYTYIQFFNLNEKETLILDSIDHALVFLRSHYKADRNTKAFSFLCTCMKHRYYDECMHVDQFPKYRFQKSIQKIDDNPEEYENVPQIEDDHEFLQDAILRRFREMLQEEVSNHHPKSKNYDPEAGTIKKKRIEYMQYAIEYCEQYNSLTIVSLNSYIQDRMKVNDAMIASLSIYYFGFGSSPKQTEGRTSSHDKRQKIASVIDDDFTPDVVRDTKSRKRFLHRSKERYIFW